MQAIPVVDTSRERRENRAKTIAKLRGQMFVALALCVAALVAIAFSVDAAGITTAVALRWSQLCAAFTLENVRPILGKAFLIAGAFTVVSVLTAALSFVPAMRWMRNVSTTLISGAAGLILISFGLFEALCIGIAGNGWPHSLGLIVAGTCLLTALCAALEGGGSARDISGLVLPISLLVFGVFAFLELITGASSAQFMPRGAGWLGLLMFGLLFVRETTFETLDEHAKAERRIDDAESGKAAVCQADDLSDSGVGPKTRPNSVQIDGAVAAEDSVAPPPDNASAS